MGYTHYWRHDADISEEAFAAIAADTRKIIAITAVRLGNSMDDGGEPDVSDDCIALNGVGDDSYESFVFDRAQGGGFSFCKTQHRPYDEVVTAILLSACVHAGDVLRVSSDGGSAMWTDGANLLHEATGRAVLTSFLDGGD